MKYTIISYCFFCPLIYFPCPPTCGSIDRFSLFFAWGWVYLVLSFLLWFAYILWLGPSLDDLLALSHFLFPVSLSFCFLFSLLLGVILFLPLISGNISLATSWHGYAILFCPMNGVALSCVHLYMLCRLPALLLAFQGPMLEMLLHIWLCIPGTTGTPWKSASQLITWPAAQSLLSSEQTLGWAVLPQVHSTYFLTFIFRSGSRDWDMVFVMVRRISTAPTGKRNLKIPLSKWRPVASGIFGVFLSGHGSSGTLIPLVAPAVVKAWFCHYIHCYEHCT